MIDVKKELNLEELEKATGGVDEMKYFSHIVMPGETPDGIAAEYGVSLAVLMALNNLDAGALLEPDQLILVPDRDHR